jgi:hypothetical protein
VIVRSSCWVSEGIDTNNGVMMIVVLVDENSARLKRSNVQIRTHRGAHWIFPFLSDNALVLF